MVLDLSSLHVHLFTPVWVAGINMWPKAVVVPTRTPKSVSHETPRKHATYRASRSLGRTSVIRRMRRAGRFFPAKPDPSGSTSSPVTTEISPGNTNPSDSSIMSTAKRGGSKSRSADTKILIGPCITTTTGLPSWQGWRESYLVVERGSTPIRI